MKKIARYILVAVVILLFLGFIFLETTDAEKPSGILMIDIDHFKDFTTATSMPPVTNV